MIRLLLIAMFVWASLAQCTLAQYSAMAPRSGDPGSNADKKPGFDMKRGNMIPLNLEFFDHHNKAVKIGDLLQGKPTILVMAYYRCPQLCNLVLQDLLQSMRTLAKGGFVCGRDYNVITVGIDPKETQHIARVKRLKFHEELDGRKEDQDGWWFLTPGHGQGTDTKEADMKVHMLADAIGYRYSLRHKNTDYTYNAELGEWFSQAGGKLRPDAREYEYIHASGITILSPTGKISQYFMGHPTEIAEADTKDDLGKRPYRATDIRLSLVEASDGKVGTAGDQIMLYCFMYDKKSEHYQFTMNWLAGIAVPFVFIIVGITVLAIRNSKKLGYNLDNLPKPGEIKNNQTVNQDQGGRS